MAAVVVVAAAAAAVAAVTVLTTIPRAINVTGSTGGGGGGNQVRQPNPAFNIAGAACNVAGWRRRRRRAVDCAMVISRPGIPRLTEIQLAVD